MMSETPDEELFASAEDQESEDESLEQTTHLLVFLENDFYDSGNPLE